MNQQQVKEYFIKTKDLIYDCVDVTKLESLLKTEDENLDVLFKDYPEVYNRLMACVRNCKERSKQYPNLSISFTVESRTLQPGEFVKVPKGIKPMPREYYDWFEEEFGRSPVTGDRLINLDNKESDE